MCSNRGRAWKSASHNNRFTQGRKEVTFPWTILREFSRAEIQFPYSQTKNAVTKKQDSTEKRKGDRYECGDVRYPDGRSPWIIRRSRNRTHYWLHNPPPEKWLAHNVRTRASHQLCTGPVLLCTILWGFGILFPGKTLMNVRWMDIFDYFTIPKKQKFYYATRWISKPKDYS